MKIRLNANKKIIITIILSIIILSAISLISLKYIHYRKSKQEISYINYLIKKGQYSKAYSNCENNNDKNIDSIINIKREQLSKKDQNAYNKGLKILENDLTAGYSNTLNYFNDYKTKYDFSDNVSNVNKLIELLNEYNEKNNKLQSLSGTTEYVNQNNELINTIENYKGTIDNFYSQVVSALITKNKNDILTAYEVWTQQASTYYSMNTNLDSIKGNIPNCIITDDELNKVKEYISNGLIPGECMAQYVSTRNLDDRLKNTFLNSYNNYSAYKSAVDSLISTKRSIIATNATDFESLQKEVDELKTKINNFK